eukprot:3232062-Prymnesium_polylepis.1
MAGGGLLGCARCRAVDSQPPPAQAFEVPCWGQPAAACLGVLGAGLGIAGRRLLRRAGCRAVDCRPPPARAREVPCCG